MNRMRKIYSVVIAFAMLASLFATSLVVYAAADVSSYEIWLEAPSAAEINVGDAIEVPVVITDRNALGGASFRVTWDSTMLSMSANSYEDEDENVVYEGVTDIAKLLGTSIVDVKAGQVTVSGGRTSDYTSGSEDYVLATLHFTVLEGAAGKDVALAFDLAKTCLNSGSADHNFAAATGASISVAGQAGGIETYEIWLEAPSAAEINVGDAIEVPVVITDRNALGGASFRVTWDSTMLSMSANSYEDEDENVVYEGVKDIAKLLGTSIVDVKAGQVTVSGGRTSDYTSGSEDYVLATLHFTVLEGAAGKDVALAFDLAKTCLNSGSADHNFAATKGITISVEGEAGPTYTETKLVYENGTLTLQAAEALENVYVLVVSYDNDGKTFVDAVISDAITIGADADTTIDIAALKAGTTYKAMLWADLENCEPLADAIDWQ